MGSGNQRRRRESAAKQAMAAARQAQAERRSANTLKAPGRGGADYAARQREASEAPAPPWWHRMWPQNTPRTIVGILFLALTVVPTAIVQADDFVTVVKRLGLPAIALAIVLLLALALGPVLVPMPSRWFVMSSTAVWAIGVIAFAVALWVANGQATQSAVAETVFGEEHGIDAEGQPVAGKRFDDADLAMSNLRDSVVTQSGFSGADLSESDFRGATFEEVDFSRSRLCAVDARGSDLSGAINLADVADWSFFVYDATTQFPSGFDIELLSGPIKVGEGTRTSFVFTCSGGPNRMLRLEATQ